MNRDLFTEWLNELDQKFLAQERKIALVFDNYCANPIVDGLKAIELILLLPNTTSKTQQLMNQSVIRSLKAFYRHPIIKDYITTIDGGIPPTKFNVFGAMTLLIAGWEYISSITLVNCLSKAGITSES